MVMGAHRSEGRAREGGSREGVDSSLCATALHLLTHYADVCSHRRLTKYTSLPSPFAAGFLVLPQYTFPRFFSI